MVKCPKCGKETDTKFCPDCGENLDTDITCPHCNAKVEKESLFCSECGKEIKLENKKEEETFENKKEDASKEEQPSEEVNYCPHCNEKLDDDEGMFCTNCGKMIEVDEYSFNGIIQSINFKRLIILSILGFIITFVLGILLSFIIGLTGQESFGYPIALIMAIFLGVGFFASFFKDILNSGLSGIIIGLLFGICANSAVEISTGFKYSFEIFSGYEIAVFTILGLIIALIANKFLRNIILKYIDVNKFFN